MPEEDVDAARAQAATRIAAMHRGKKAREEAAAKHMAAIKLQSIQRGKLARRRFNLSEAVHAPKLKPTEEELEQRKQLLSSTGPLSLSKLGLKRGLPQNPVPDLAFLTFNSWWVEMGTKRYMEVCLDLNTQLFQVILDKKVQTLDREQVYNARYDSMQKVVEKDTKVMSMHLHEKLSGNQHAESLRREHLECWDLHVGAKLNILGRPTTLMQCNLLTAKWLEYHADRLQRIKGALEEHLTKYETVQMMTIHSSKKGVGGTVLGHGKKQGSSDLRMLLNQIEALQQRLAVYRPGIAAQLAQLADKY